MAVRRSHSPAEERVVETGTEARESERPFHLLDLGEASASEVRELKRGRGVLVDDVADAVAQVEALLGSERAGKVILPLVVVVEKKRAREAMGMFPLSFPFFLMRR